MNIGRDSETIIRLEDVNINVRELFNVDDWIYDIKTLFTENITPISALYKNKKTSDESVRR